MRRKRLASRHQPVLRLAHLLTEDPVEAVGLAVQALARLPLRSRRGEVDLDRLAARHVLQVFDRRHPRGPVVLALALGWGPAAIAEVSRRSERSVRADVAEALRRQSEEQWSAEFADRRWNLPVPPDLETLVEVERARRAGRRRRALVGGASIATALIATTVAVVRVVTAPGPLPRAAHEAGLLSWPARGDLSRDSSVIGAAARAWRSSANPPGGRVYVLYAGTVDERRLLVLQGFVGGRPAVALVEDSALEHVAPLPSSDPPAITVTYDPGSGVDVTRLLTAPTVVRVGERRAVNAVLRQRPAYLSRSLNDGMSEPWVTPGRTAPPTAVQLTDSDGRTTTALLVPGALLPVVMHPAVSPPPARWAGLPVRVDPTVLADDAIWFGQLCTDPQPTVQLVWSGRVPGFAAPVRVERVGCAGQFVARFLTGRGSHAVTLAGDASGQREPAAYGAVVTPPTTLGRAYVVVVGSRRVAEIAVAGDRRRVRVAVVRLERSRGLRIYAADGTRILLR